MAYQSLYRKYRPQRFGELVGQEHVTTALRNAVREGRVGHAYLFSGPRGHRQDHDGAHPGQGAQLPEPRRRRRAVRRLRELRRDRRRHLPRPRRARRGVEQRRRRDPRPRRAGQPRHRRRRSKKVYILDEVHMLSAAASNALLKTLEEPPDHVVFVLATTNPEKVLPTIRSRTQHFEFTLLHGRADRSRILADVLEREGVEADPEALALIARPGGGSARDALSLLDQALAHAPGPARRRRRSSSLFGGSPFEHRVGDPRGGRRRGRRRRRSPRSASCSTSGHEPRRVADDLLRTLRDAFLLTAGARPGARRRSPRTSRRACARSATRSATPLLVRVLETLGQAVVDMRGTDAADPRLVLEIALVRLARRDAGPPIAGARRPGRAARAGARSAERPRRRRPRRRARGAAPPPAAAPARTARPTARVRGPGPAVGVADATPARRRAGEAPPAAGTHRRRARRRGPPATEAAGRRRRPSRRARPRPRARPPSRPRDRLARPRRRDRRVGRGPADAARCRRASAVQEAQPIAVEGDVVVFGVAPRALDRSAARFRRDAPDDPGRARRAPRREPTFQRRRGRLAHRLAHVAGAAAGAATRRPPRSRRPPPTARRRAARRSSTSTSWSTRRRPTRR